MGEPPESPEDPTLVLGKAVLNYYLENHVPGIRAKVPAKRACALVHEYMTTATGSAAWKIGEFNLPRQHAFMRHLAGQKLAAKTISTYLSSIKAAVNFAARPRLFLDSRNIEREGRMLAAPTFVLVKEADVSKITGRPRSTPRSFCPTHEQLARFIDAIDGDGFNQDSGRQAALFRYVIMALNTWARPEAITDLIVSKQVDFQRGLVDLNPPERAQNKKFRPMIRLTDNLRGWLIYWNLDKPIIRGVPGAYRRYGRHGKPVNDVPPQTFRKVALSVDMPQLNRYALRHFMATRVRAVPGIPVTREERAMWLGHIDPQHRQTMWYERFDADHLEAARRATDATMEALDKLCTKRLWAPGTSVSHRLTVIGAPTEARDANSVSI